MIALGLAAAATAIAAMAILARSDAPAARVSVPVLFGAMLLVLWQVMVTGFGISAVILPPPTAIAAALVRNRDVLGADFRQTVLRSVVPGYAIGCGSGFLAALAIERSDFLRRGLLPLGNFASAMPIVGIAPIMVMWFGFDWPSKAAVVTVMTFFPMLVNTIAGLSEAGAIERDLMRCYAAGPWTTLLKLRLPAAMPFVFNALKLNSTLALIGAVVAEFFGTPILGMGFRISTEAARMNLDIVWATIVVTALTGCLSFAAIAGLERLVTFWHPSYRTR